MLTAEERERLEEIVERYTESWLRNNDVGFLLSLIDRLVKDGERLDWLDKDRDNNVYPSRFGEEAGWQVDNHFYRELRNAIDHARNPNERYDAI